MLPLPKLGGRRKLTSRSQRCRQRRARNIAIDTAVNAMVDVLNDMWGQGRRPPRHRQRWRWRAAAVRDAHLHLRASVIRAERSPTEQSALGSDGARNETADSSKTLSVDDYGVLEEEYGGIRYMELTAANIALPSREGAIVPLEDLLPPEWAARLLSGDGIIKVGPAPPLHRLPRRGG